MFNDWKYRLTTGWNLSRILRGLLALTFIIAAFTQGDWLVMIAGGFLLAQSLLNFGCCSIGGCDVESAKTKSTDENQVAFEEIRKP